MPRTFHFYKRLSVHHQFLPERIPGEYKMMKTKKALNFFLLSWEKILVKVSVLLILSVL
jgi:hypothetical protein